MSMMMMPSGCYQLCSWHCILQDNIPGLPSRIIELDQTYHGSLVYFQFTFR